MCGIFASALSSIYVSRMLDKMRYRGPDEKHVVGANGFQVGFVRLAIMDTESPFAVQPFLTRGGLTVVFNGEIYNYKDLDPNAHSEVQLLGRMLDEGIDPRQFVDGDYAILAHDPTHSRVTLYRDRFGACPLYFQLKPHIAVSSEARRLRRPMLVRQHERVVLKYDREGVGSIESQDTLPHYGITFGHYDSRIFRGLFHSAVRSRALHSEVGFSTTCSGGIDSSAVMTALRHENLEPKSVICVSFGEDTEDLNLARQVADYCRFELTEVIVDQDMIERERSQILEHMDGGRFTPLRWRVALRDWFVAKAAKTKVVLTGEGSDELCEGYPPHPERLVVPYRIGFKQLGQLRSLPACSLYYSNKIGLAHSKEFRAPFLQSALSYYMLSCATGPRKKILREYLEYMGAPRSLIERDKWGANEQRLDASV